MRLWGCKIVPWIGKVVALITVHSRILHVWFSCPIIFTLAQSMDWPVSGSCSYTTDLISQACTDFCCSFVIAFFLAFDIVNGPTFLFNRKIRRIHRKLIMCPIAPMHDYVRRVNFTNKPRLWTKFFAFALFVRGYSFQLYCLGNSFLWNFAYF